jgi:hypothetical protein
MSIEGLMVSFVLLLVVILVIILPLLRRISDVRIDDARIDKQRERLFMYYERVLTNIRDLDEDRATGKMSDADYAPEREEWVQRGIQVLKALDNLEEHSIIPSVVSDDAAVDEAIDDAIEAAIRSYRKSPANN